MKKIVILLFIHPSLLQAQNVGIGTTAPTGKLEIHHRSTTAAGLKLVDSATNIGGAIEFRNLSFTRGMKISGFSSTNFNNGQYLDFRSDSLTVMTIKGNGFVGIRDIEPSYPLDVQGDINTTGLLRVNGNSGLSGQVLSSNGTADPVWRNAALTNTNRFAVNFREESGSLIADAEINSTKYNLNPADIVIGTNSITINQSGLYHFDLGVSPFISFSTAISSVNTFNLTFITGTVGYEFMRNKLMTPNSSSNTAWRLGESYTLECYVQAPAVIRIAYSFGFTTPITYFMSGYLTGHLISE